MCYILDVEGPIFGKIIKKILKGEVCGPSQFYVGSTCFECDGQSRHCDAFENDPSLPWSSNKVSICAFEFDRSNNMELEAQWASHEGIQVMLQSNMDQVPKMDEKVPVIHQYIMTSKVGSKGENNIVKILFKMTKHLTNLKLWNKGVSLTDLNISNPIKTM